MVPHCEPPEYSVGATTSLETDHTRVAGLKTVDVQIRVLEPPQHTGLSARNESKAQNRCLTRVRDPHMRLVARKLHSLPRRPHTTPAHIQHIVVAASEVHDVACRRTRGAGY